MNFMVKTLIDKDLLEVQLLLFRAWITEGNQCKDSGLTMRLRTIIKIIVKHLASLSVGEQVSKFLF